MVKVSVIIPTYNRAALLQKAISSVLAQTFTNFEIIVVDDGSKDNTRTTVTAIDDHRIHYIYQENAGLATARNRGLQLSTGKYVAFLDDDDLFLPNKLQIQVQKLENNQVVGLVSGGWIYIDIEGTKFRENRPWEWRPVLNLDTWLVSCPTIVNAVLVRRSWLEHVKGFDETLQQSEDWDLWLRLAYAGCQMEWVEEIVCAYRTQPGSMVHNAQKQRRYMVSVLDKFFCQTDLPEELARKKNYVYGLAYSRGAAREYAADMGVEAAEDLDRALRLNPGFLDNNGDPLIYSLIAWINDPIVKDWNRYINCIFDHLPSSALIIKSRKNEVLGLAARQMFYSAKKYSEWESMKKHLLFILQVQPGLLINRGVISGILMMVSHSIFGKNK